MQLLRSLASLALVSLVSLVSVASPASAQTASPAPEPSGSEERTTDATVVTGHYENGVGTSDAASQGTVTAKLIANRPILRTAEVLELIPGLIVSQHSGDGKANQYYLRGFNLDHGTDFATFVDGMPVNAPTHAHGQGYTDINFLIPELIRRIDYKKGPYYADEGDFSSAGAAHIRLFDAFTTGIATVTAGTYGYERGFVAKSMSLGAGTLLFAIDASHNNGPWDVPENARKASAVLRYNQGDAGDGFTLTAMGYDAQWRSTDQIPARAVDSGLVDRFGSLDPSDGGRTSRFSLSGEWRKSSGNGDTRFSAYAVQSRLNLFSDFTYFLDDPVNGDQFEQAERRRTAGFEMTHSWPAKLGAFDSSNRIGFQGRFDRLDPVGLYRTLEEKRIGTTSESVVDEGSAALFFENTLNWTAWMRTIAGIRHDRYRFDVTSNIAANSGRVSSSITSPKLSLVLGPWRKTELFVNYGEGFHSNDARGTTARVAPGDGTPVDPVTPLVKSRGSEVGLRSQIVPGLETSLAIWRLELASELVFSGDAGDTEASRASLRRGIEWNNHYVPLPWLLVDLDLAWSRTRFTESAPEGQYVPGSVERVASLGIAITDRGPWSGAIQLRYFGPRPLIEDNSVRSHSTSIANLRIGYRIDRRWQVTLDALNIFDRSQSDIDYFYASRLRGEPSEGVDDVHLHPAEPRMFRLSLTGRF